MNSPIKYEFLIIYSREGHIKRGDSVNALIGIRNIGSEDIEVDVNLYVVPSDLEEENSTWKLAETAQKKILAKNTLHVYMNIPASVFESDYWSGYSPSEFCIYVGNIPPLGYKNMGCRMQLVLVD